MSCGAKVPQDIVELHTYISWKLLEGVEHVEAVEVNNSSCQCVIVPAATEVKKSDRGISATDSIYLSISLREDDLTDRAQSTHT